MSLLLRGAGSEGGLPRAILSAYQSRVQADNGSTDADLCALGQLNSLNNNQLLGNASFVWVPQGYKVGKLYAQVPENGNGDMTFSRASGAWSINSAGILEQVGANLPRLDYSSGACPVGLFEPQRTNKVSNSNDFSGYSQTGTVTRIPAFNTYRGISTTKVVFSTPATKTALWKADHAVTNGTVVTASIFIRSLSGTQEISFCSAGGLAPFGKQSVGIEWTRISASVTVTTTGNLLFGIMQEAGYIITNGEFEIMGFQVEDGSYPSSYIHTNGSAQTRMQDGFSRGNIYTNGIVSNAGGTWMFEVKNNFSFTSDVPQAQQFGLGNNITGSSADNIWVGQSTTGRLIVWKQVGGALTALYILSADRSKVVCKWNGANLDVFVNGVKVVASVPFTPLMLENVRVFTVGTPFCIQVMALWNTPLSEQQCLQLST